MWMIAPFISHAMGAAIRRREWDMPDDARECMHAAIVSPSIAQKQIVERLQYLRLVTG